MIITESQATSSFTCCHISVIGLTPSKVRPVMWLCSSKLPIHSVRFLFFFYLLYQLLFLSSIMQITPARKWKVHQHNGQFSCTDSLLFKDRSFICTLHLIDLVKQIQRTIPKGMNTEACRFPLTEQDVSFLDDKIHH